MKYTVIYGEGVRKDLRRLDKSMQSKVYAAVEALADNPRPHGCRKMIGYTHRWRIRIGDYRVVYDIHDDVVTVYVTNAGHRSNIYR